MNFKKVFAGSLTGALVAAMSCTAFAGEIFIDSEDTNLSVDKGAAQYDVKAAGLTADDLNGHEMVMLFTVDDSDGFGGGIMFNATTGGWMQTEDYYWGNADAGKALVAEGEEGYYSVSFTIPEGTYSDADFAEDGYAQIMVQQWWGNDITICYLARVEDLPADGEEDEEVVSYGSVSYANPVVIEGATGDGAIGLACSFLMEGDVSWNDWCTFVVKVDDENGTNYYVVAGAQVSWDVTVDSENEIVVPVADMQFVPSGDDSYVATIPVTGDYTLTVFTGSWDSAPDTAFISVDGIYTTGGVIEDETDEEETDEEETEEVIEDETDEEETEEVVDDEDNNDPIGLSYNGPFTLEGATGDGNIGVACSFVMEGEGDAYWNDWCTFVIKVEDENGTNYYVVAGAQVSWDVTVDEENEIVVPVADMQVVPSGDDSYVATIPVKGDYKLSFSTGSWDNAPDAAFIYIDNIYTTGGLDVDDDVEADDTADVAPIAALALMSILGLGVMVASKKRA